MSKQKKTKKRWIDRFEKKWQRAAVTVVLCIAVSCLTFCVLLGVETLFAKDTDTKQSATASSSTVTASASTAVIGTILPETADAGRSYLDDTLFLGDSNTVRFMAYNDETDDKPFTSTDNTIAVVGMGVQAISTLNCEQLSTGTYTMVEAVSILQPKRIIVTFGTNNLDGVTTDVSYFIEQYTTQLKNIEEAYPSVDIIVNSIPPVAQINSYSKVKPFQIELYNNAIIAMCDENGWKYLNSYEALADEETGYAKDGYMSGDGLHFNETGLQALFDYIRTHAYITEDDRPKPLADIPEIYGPMTTLYTVNPLNNQTFSEDVLNPTAEPANTPASTPEENTAPPATATATATATAAPTPTPSVPAVEPSAATNQQTTTNNTTAESTTSNAETTAVQP